MDGFCVDMNELCTLYNKRLFQVAYCITRDYYLAQDAVQETLIKAYQKMGTIEDPEKIGAWLSAIAARAAIDIVRKERKIKDRTASHVEIETANIKMDQNVEKEVEMNLLKEQIHQAINSLSLDQRKVFLLKINSGLKEKEIAQLLKINQNTVKTKIYRVRKQLKEMLMESLSA
ncbi:sigma-70 family RNA polymerase sigma factor [Cytobacillus sp.]|uniref:RNA polymerase sigma factor n=1 Tax=Cytobacillus sp. TaxID=2675269 RepID=UPI0028BF3254|nr:sigma-70 family RNA polymerase sigma factor [Cytobacillus sp.]